MVLHVLVCLCVCMRVVLGVCVRICVRVCYWLCVRIYLLAKNLVEYVQMCAVFGMFA